MKSWAAGSDKFTDFVSINVGILLVLGFMTFQPLDLNKKMSFKKSFISWSSSFLIGLNYLFFEEFIVQGNHSLICIAVVNPKHDWNLTSALVDHDQLDVVVG